MLMKLENEELYDDLLEVNVSGKEYTDDELRDKFKDGMAVLEKKGDYDAVMSYMTGDYESQMIILWKALGKAGVKPDNLTGRQFMHLRDILKGVFENA